MGIGAVAEPLVVVSLLFGGAWFNRNTGRDDAYDNLGWADDLTDLEERKRDDDKGSPRPSGRSSPSSDAPFLVQTSPLSAHEEPPRRIRRLKFLHYQRMVATPNTRVFKDRLLSRLLRKFPFLVEAWYWALIYWVYQLGRAFTALTLVEGTVDVARRHALQVIHVEQALGIFIEVPIQQFFMQFPTVMHWINRIYSFIHIPGTILFLVILYFITTTRRRRAISARMAGTETAGGWSAAGPALYEARRRTMATCNLLAFVVFTLWPCMPPRLLSDPNYTGEHEQEAKSFGFVDTVHSATGESSVWTTNKFCNQYAAMPSLHFGYSLLIGLTIATLPMNTRTRSWKRIGVVALGMSYPTLILLAIVSTANHFILDAVAGALVCAIAWNANGILLNCLVLEDYFLWLVRIHKPVNYTDPETSPEDAGWRPSALLDQA